jgi:HEAT repeat protein
VAERQDRFGQSSLDAREARARGDEEYLLRMLVNADQIGRVAAAHALGDMRSKRAVNELVRCLRSRDPGLQISCLKALGSIGDESAVPPIMETATGDFPFGVRAAAAEALARLGDSRSTRLIGALLLEPKNESGSWKWAANLFVELGTTEAIAELEAARAGASLTNRFRLRRAIRSLRAAAQ